MKQMHLNLESMYESTTLHFGRNIEKNGILFFQTLLLIIMLTLQLKILEQKQTAANLVAVLL